MSIPTGGMTCPNQPLGIATGGVFCTGGQQFGHLASSYQGRVKGEYEGKVLAETYEGKIKEE